MRRTCGVPGSSERRIAGMAKVLDDWERRNPETRRHLEAMFGRELGVDDMIRRLQEQNGNVTITNATGAPTLSPTLSPTFAPTGSPTRVPTRRPTRAPTRRPTQAPVRVAQRPKIRNVTVWWHVMKAGDTWALGRWPRRLVVQSINMANHFFAGSPFRFVLGGITQSTNARWFRCPKEDDYATGTRGLALEAGFFPVLGSRYTCTPQK
jgi:hypothetical protein